MFVPGNKLRQIIGEAHTDVNGAMLLLKKLIPLVFSNEELANSCGQGIGSSQLTESTDQECKNPLNAEKIQVIKGKKTIYIIL